PPDLMTPAKLSNPRMNETGPDAVPPPERCSRLERNREKLVPVPDPNLKSSPSVRTSSRMLSMLSSTPFMKQAEHCGPGSMPTLNHTGELKASFWFRSR